MTTAAHSVPATQAPTSEHFDLGSFEEPWAISALGEPMHDGASDTEKIVAAAGAVESLEWELDRAELALAEAIECAVSNGCGVDVVAESAGLTREQVTAKLWEVRSRRNQF